MNSRIIALLGAIVLAGATAGCGKDDEGTGPGMGTVTVRLTDAPAQFDQVNIVVTGVQILRGTSEQTGSWEALEFETATINLLTLQNGVIMTLSEGTVPAGHYSQIRLMVGSGSTIVVDGVTHPLEIPSGTQSGIKVIGGFDVPSGGDVDIVLDWDAARSIHLTGNGRYIMQPVIRMLVSPAQNTGRISGDLAPDGVDASVYAISGPDTVTSATPTSSGAFTLFGLPAGTYSVAVDVASGYRDTTLSSVQVVTGQTTNLGTIQLEAQ